MGLLDYFSKDKRVERGFDRAVRNVLRKTRAKDERMDEPISYLAEIGTDEALLALLRRYDIIIRSDSMDRFEKELICSLLVEKGARAIPPIRTFLGESENVTWPIQALRSITTEDQVIEILLDVLSREVGKDSFKPDKKVRLLELLEDHIDSRVPPVVVGALVDFDETVRFRAVELLFAQGGEAAAREPLLALLTDEEEESQRIRNRILTGFVETGWTVKGFRKAVEAVIGKTQWIDRQGRIKQRGA
ncbi:MAG: hypothetical protein QGH45_23235 [Myxococcota bacterium]|jgi:hypothetical protein|nr:hypothetical protein [Myxococcota bacterium]